MANIKSAIKRIRTNKRNQMRNKGVVTEIKTALKTARAASTDKKVQTDKIRSAIKLIDKAVQRGIIHRNTAARKKSRLMAAAA